MIFILVRRHVTFICRLRCSTFGKQICLLRRVDRQYSISPGIWQATPCSSAMGFPIKNFENQLIFDKVKAFDTNCAIFGPSCILWRQQWTATAAEQRPNTATAALSNSVKFPNVFPLLTILGITLPVTTSESERVFSKLQRTLTSIRSMTEDRLVLFLLQCHREHSPTNDVLSTFGRKARRLNFVL